MLRTRDLLWFVIVLVFLGLAILSTTINRSPDTQSGLSLPSLEAEAPDYAAELEEGAKLDRNANIERLRSLLAEGDIVSASPSVEDEVFDASSEIDDGGLECGAVDSGISIARSWPLSGVSVSTVGGTRVVTYTATAAAVPISGSTTPMASPAVTKTLLVLSQFPVKAGQPTCLDSEVIGVTVDGSLMFNNDVVLYRNTAANTLIGFARDGFPVYGAYSGEVDECGGYDGPGGYRYVVVPGESAFINCFTGAPSSFTP